MPSTYEAISTQTLNSTVSSVTFSSIPATYTDLVLVASVRAQANNFDFGVRYNGDSGANYSWTTAKINADEGGNPQAQRSSSTSAIYTRTNINNTSPNPIMHEISNYTNSQFKSSISSVSIGTYGLARTAGLWRNTSAITSLTCVLINGGSTSFISGSIFTLYGIKGA